MNQRARHTSRTHVGAHVLERNRASEVGKNVNAHAYQTECIIDGPSQLLRVIVRTRRYQSFLFGDLCKIMKASFVSMFCLSFTANVNVAAHIVVHNARQCPARRNNRKPAKCGQDSMRIDPMRSMLDC